MEVPGYKFPDEIGPGPLNNIDLDPITGNFVWDVPRIQGEYNIAIKINEWRNGVLLNSIIRDMQILVLSCENHPPTITAEEEICVVAGEEINLPILVNDEDQDQLVHLTASGGPFIIDNNPAVIENNPGLTSPPYTANFVWQTNCNHISNEYYQVVLRAVDNFFADSTGLATLHTIRIKVVGPAPENLEAEPDQGGISLTWDAPYNCEITNDEFFQGFSVWRKIGSSEVPLDTCNPGLTGSPYQKIVFNTLAKNEEGKYFIFDENLDKGITYCYRVQAEFAQITSSGNPYNRTESLPSNEVCQQLKRDLPLITKVSIQNTDINTGEVHFQWSKPLVNDLDTVVNPGPYTYELLKSIDGGISYEIVEDFTITTPFLESTIDTNFIDNSFNTVDLQPYYKINFYANNSLYGESSFASSTYLTANPSDKSIELNWQEEVPWSKRYSNVYVQLPGETNYTFLGETTSHSFLHQNLDNDETYCYYIESFGSYNIDKIQDPLINLSQELCISPIDNVPPCPPSLTVSNICDEENPINYEDLVNYLNYSRPNASCLETNDVEGYYIYFSEIEGQALIKIDSIFNESTNTYEHTPERGISGCYAITAFDFLGNESELSNIVCVDNCPEYELPNTFTPNNDGANDLFVPRINRFISAVDFTVYNEWGNKVFSTNDPEINWSGVDFNNRELSEGTYYYTCSVLEQRVSGNIQSSEILKGYIHLIR